MGTMQKSLIELKDFIEKEERDTIDKDWLIRWIEKQLLPIEQEPIIDSEGNKYSTIKIGGQEWLIDLAGFKDSKDGWHIPTDEDIAKLNKFIEQEPPKDTDELKDELLKFKKWYDSLSPASKCTVHPPAGSGGSYGLYNLTNAGLINNYLKRQ